MSASVTDDAVHLTWNLPTGNDAVTMYRILRHRPEEGEPEPLVYVDYTLSGATNYTDTAVEPGVRYVYSVQSVDFFGDLGEASEPVSVRVPDSNNPAGGAPTINGAAQVGQALTVDTSGITDADGLVGTSYAYQWIRSDGGVDTDIPGATNSTYALAPEDLGKTIKVRVSFTDDRGNEESVTSRATGAVIAAPPEPGLSLTDFEASEGQDVLASALNRVGDLGRKNNGNRGRAWYALETFAWHASGELRDGSLTWNDMTVKGSLLPGNWRVPAQRGRPHSSWGVLRQGRSQPRADNMDTYGGRESILPREGRHTVFR